MLGLLSPGNAEADVRRGRN